ncbi:MAG: hypothetical protein E6J19_09495 [Chloroflexi bacterium]|nr:MAG: hypothetical protein E6J49_03345 [Chloroflexota bacterium]TMC30938.1 MAG: hypothetical protein E6J27_01230 [Chloroflexota bacterium]TMC33609.1 MAG: hypothetical protein E6J24_09155 [Chloroflexota bacterium]TMC56328.1 MAG: hypothetical protein E6J19_09495 [Chloroflexota bacterium]
MADEQHVQVIDLRGRRSFLDELLRADGVSVLGHKAETPRHAMHMRVDRKVWTAEREEQHAGRGLRTDAFQADKQIPQSGRTHSRERALVQRDAAIA